MLSGTFAAALVLPTTEFVVFNSTLVTRSATDGVACTNRHNFGTSATNVPALFGGTGTTIFATGSSGALKHVFCGILSATAGASSLRCDTRVTSFTGTTGAAAINSLRIGAACNATQFLSGKFAEYIAIAGAATQAVITEIMDYLGARYAITISA